MSSLSGTWPACCFSASTRRSRSDLAMSKSGSEKPGVDGGSAIRPPSVSSTHTLNSTAPSILGSTTTRSVRSLAVRAAAAAAASSMPRAAVTPRPAPPSDGLTTTTPWSKSRPVSCIHCSSRARAASCTALC